MAGNNELPNFDEMSACTERSLECGEALLHHQEDVANQLKLLCNIPALKAIELCQRIVRNQGRIMRNQEEARVSVSNMFMASNQNNAARFENSKVNNENLPLEPMVCVREDHDGLKVNDVISDFPATAAQLSRLDGESCRRILHALGKPLPPRATSMKVLRTLLGRAIGVPNVWS